MSARKPFARIWPLAFLGLAACPTGYRLVRVNGEKPGIDDAMWDRVECTTEELAKATGVCAERKRPKMLVHCNGTPDEAARCATTPSDRKTTVLRAADASKLKRLITFVHLSDGQLKEEAIHMDGAVSDVTYDALTNGALRNPLLEKNDDAVLLATTLAVNEMNETTLGPAYAPYPPPKPPSFVIHTGDSVDSGMYSELVQFIAAMDALQIPWFNAIGNHDNLFFGTFPPSEMRGLDVLMPFVPIVDTDRFMRFHSVRGVELDSSLPSLTHRGPDHGPTATGTRYTAGRRGARVVGRGSDYHGFDLACASSGLDIPDDKGRLCPDARGYYAFDAPLADGSGNLRAIVLNTAEIVPTTVATGFDRRSRGNMYPEQLRWLRQQLDEDRPDILPENKGKDVFIVFGHHNLRSFLHDDQGEELRRILVGNPRVLAYVTGHTHVDDTVEWKRPDGSPFWEVVGGSTLVFPQLARVMDLLEDDRGALFLRVAPFRQGLGDDPDGVPIVPSTAASTPAKPPTETVVPPSDAAPPRPERCGPIEERTSFCSRLAHRAHDGRSGAEADNDADKRPEIEAVEKTEGVLPVGVRNAPSTSSRAR